MNEKNVIFAARDITNAMNYRMHAGNLHIPVLEGFEIKKDDNPRTILLAIRDGMIEQLISDGYIDVNKFDERITSVINSSKEFMKKSGCQNIENSIIYYDEYNNGVFNFKLYFNDMIIPKNGKFQIIRQLNAYFIEPKMKDFYQLSLSAGPFKYPNEELKLGTIDLDNDSVSRSLVELMKKLMNNLKYKN